MSKERPSIDKDLIRELAEILKETELTEIEIEQAGLKLRVARNAIVSATVPMSLPASPASAGAEIATARPAADQPGTITSPMVGTAYLSPDPDSKPFVEIGQTVREGQTLLIVEAMKTFNPIASPRAGTVKAILVETGQPVEFGEPLIVVE